MPFNSMAKFPVKKFPMNYFERIYYMGDPTESWCKGKVFHFDAFTSNSFFIRFADESFLETQKQHTLTITVQFHIPTWLQHQLK